MTDDLLRGSGRNRNRMIRETVSRRRILAQIGAGSRGSHGVKPG